MIYVTGDLHAYIDIAKLEKLSKNNKLTKDDYIIICGDFGLVWTQDRLEKKYREWLNSQNWATLFIDGNHENYDELDKYPIVSWHKGNVSFIEDSIIHLLRGQVYEIDGKKFFTMGGAECHDKEWREYGVSMWKHELPTVSEYQTAEANLSANDHQVDYILTHCIGDDIQDRFFPGYPHNDLTRYLNELETKISYKHWYFGHYHNDHTIDDKHTLCYNVIQKIK